MTATITPLEALRRLIAEVKQLDAVEVGARWNQLQGELGMAEGVVRDFKTEPVAHLRFRAAQQWSGVGGHDIENAEWLETCQQHEVGDDKIPAFPVWTYPVSPEPVVAQSSEAAGQSNFIAMTESESFKYALEQLASGSPNPKERRRLVREVREAIKECAASQRQNSVEKLYGSAWIKIADGLPDPYEEVRILFDGVPRIARLCHSREYFQLATFIDSTKSQYIAKLENVSGWMRIPLSPAPTAAEKEKA